jgi:hypothetical protein
MINKLLLSTIFLSIATAQQVDTVIRVTTRTVVAPTSVKDRDGNAIEGLDVKDFILRDNGKVQDLKLDQAYVPVSLVLVVQRSASTEKVLPTVMKIGSMLEPLIIGERGEGKDAPWLSDPRHV